MRFLKKNQFLRIFFDSTTKNLKKIFLIFTRANQSDFGYQFQRKTVRKNCHLSKLQKLANLNQQKGQEILKEKLNNG